MEKVFFRNLHATNCLENKETYCFLNFLTASLLARIFSEDWKNVFEWSVISRLYWIFATEFAISGSFSDFFNTLKLIPSKAFQQSFTRCGKWNVYFSRIQKKLEHGWFRLDDVFRSSKYTKEPLWYSFRWGCSVSVRAIYGKLSHYASFGF